MTAPATGPRPTRDPLVVVALFVSVASLVVSLVTLVVVSTGGRTSDATDSPEPRPAGPGPAGPPVAPGPSGPPGGTRTVRPSPSVTRLAWRSERLRDGSLTMIVGDIDAAPVDRDRIGGTDYRSATDQAKIIKVRGWWCVTRAPGALTLSGGRLRSIGFSTQCSGRPGRMRQRYLFTRSSWTGMRPYVDDRTTPWTAEQDQRGGALDVPCPAGRTGTYDYRLSVTLEIEGRPVYTDAAHGSDGFRGDCGTGVS
jgi:hypothetical protein